MYSRASQATSARHPPAMGGSLSGSIKTAPGVWYHRRLERMTLCIVVLRGQIHRTALLTLLCAGWLPLCGTTRDSILLYWRMDVKMVCMFIHQKEVCITGSSGCRCGCSCLCRSLVLHFPCHVLFNFIQSMI